MADEEVHKGVCYDGLSLIHTNFSLFGHSRDLFPLSSQNLPLLPYRTEAVRDEVAAQVGLRVT